MFTVVATDSQGNRSEKAVTLDINIVYPPAQNVSGDVSGTQNNDHYIGSIDSDSITAYAGHDLIKGMGGNDTIDGGLGDDYIEGNTGNDTIKDYYGTNSILAGDGADEIHIAGESAFIDAGSDASNDRIYYSDLTGTTTIVAGLGDDRIEGRHISELTERVHENLIVYLDEEDGEANDDGNDFYISSDPHLSTKIYGRGGNDNIITNAVNIFADGGIGNDTITGYQNSSYSRYEKFGDPSEFEWRASLKGGEGEDTLGFSYYSNIHYDWDHDFVLDGGPGHDIIHSEGGWNPGNGWTRNPGIRALGGDGNDTFRINGFIKDIVLSG